MTRTIPIPMRVASPARRTRSSPGQEANIFDSVPGCAAAEDDELTVSSAELMAQNSEC